MSGQKGKTWPLFWQKSKKEVLITHFAIIMLYLIMHRLLLYMTEIIKICIVCFIAFGVVATYWAVEFIHSPYTSFSDCFINYSTEDKGTRGILGLTTLRSSRSSGSRSFWDSIRPIGMSIDCVTIFLWDFCTLAHYVFRIIVL